MLILGGNNGTIWYSFWHQKKELALSYIYMEKIEKFIENFVTEIRKYGIMHESLLRN